MIYYKFHNVLNKAVIQKILLIIAIISIAISIYIFNYLFPLYADDWAYSFKEVNLHLNPESTERIKSLSDIFESQYAHYFNWGGRTIVHIIAQFLILSDPAVHDILNTLAYIALLYIIYLICNKRKPVNAFVFILISALVWFLIPRFTSDVLWITGSANYMWGTLIVILFLYPYIRYYIEDKTNDSYIKAAMYFMFGIIAGWTSETMSSTTIVLAFIFCIYYRKYKSLPKWAVFGLVGLCIGFAVMILAPGNMVRNELIQEQHPHLFNQPFFDTILIRLSDMLPYKYLYYMLPPTILYILFLFVYYISCRTQKIKVNIKIVTLSVLFLLAGQFSFFIMLMSPIFPLRTMFGQVIFIIIGIGILYANIELRKPLLTNLNLLLFVIIVGMYSADYYRKYPSMKLISDVYKEREASLYIQKAEGKQDIVFTRKIVVHHKFDFIELGEPEDWLNQKYAFYYGVRSVTLIPERIN